MPCDNHSTASVVNGSGEAMIEMEPTAGSGHAR